MDDCVCVSENGERVLMELDIYFPLKPGSTHPPNIYIGGKFSKVVFPNGVRVYAFSSSQYVQESINNVEDHMEKQRMKLSLLAST